MLRVLAVFLLLLSMAVFAAACGGDDDDGGGNGGPFGSGDDDGGSDDDGSSGDNDDADDGDSDDDGSGDDGGSDDGGSGGGDLDLDEIPDGGYANGTLRVQISGDADDDFELEDGGGFATEGFATIVFTDNAETTVNVAFGTEAEPGAIALVSGEVVTGGEFGTGCSVTLHADDDGINGEIDCEDLDGFNPDNNDVYDNIDLHAEFSLDRQ